MKILLFVFLTLLAFNLPARAQKIVDHCAAQNLTVGQNSQYQYMDKTGNLCINGGVVTPVNVGGISYIARTVNTIITAGQCAHGCEVYDTSANGFWVDQTGVDPVAGVSQFIQAGGSWYSPVGLTTVVKVMPFTTGIIGGTVQ